MGSDQSSDDPILELASEYATLRFTLRQLRSHIDDAEDRRGPRIRGAENDPYLTSLREQYMDGKRRVAEIREALSILEPLTFDAVKAKAAVLEAEKMQRGPSLRRAYVATARAARQG